jgi:hypothetical protein
MAKNNQSDADRSRAQAASDEAAYKTSKNSQTGRDVTAKTASSIFLPRSEPYRMNKGLTKTIQTGIMTAIIVAIAFVAIQNLPSLFVSKSSPPSGAAGSK